MRLTDLRPRWLGFGSADMPEMHGKRLYIGVTFDCPHCRTQRLAVMFDPPIDDNVGWLFATWPKPEGLRWQRTGDTFDTLTLSPSVDTTGGPWIQFGKHWHGHIKSGEVTTCA